MFQQEAFGMLADALYTELFPAAVFSNMAALNINNS